MIAVAKPIVLGLALGAVAATIWASGHRTRRLEAKQLQKDLQTWEDESGNPAPAAAVADDPLDR
jgi:hypothetical protein